MRNEREDDLGDQKPARDLHRYDHELVAFSGGKDRIAAALAEGWPGPIPLPPGQAWRLPAGAFGDHAGPG